MRKRIAVLILPVMLCICLLCGCGAVRKMPFSNAVKQIAQPLVIYHTGLSDRLSVSAEAGAGKLCADPVVSNFAYLDAYTGCVWSALPDRANTLASVVSAALISREGRFFLNSQDNAVAFGTAQTENTAEGLRVTYKMAQTKEVAECDEDTLPSGEPYLRLSLLLVVDDGKLTVSVDCGELFVADGFMLEKLTLLPYFGASVYEEGVVTTASPAEHPEVEPGGVLEVDASGASLSDEDYLVVPDGCGAMIRTGVAENAGMNYSYTVHTGDGVNTPYVPAAVFGVKRGNAAFVCAVTEGDAVSTVRALNYSNEGAAFNMVYAEFLITDTSASGNTIYYGESYKGKIRLVYKFLGGVTADYISMASSAGEELIRAGILPNASISDSVVPLNVSLICSADGTKGTAVSGYEQAEEMLGVLKAKGVNRANVILQGAFEGGLAQRAVSTLWPLKILGGKDALVTLCDYAEKQGFDLFAGVNLLASDKRNAALATDGNKVSGGIRNPLYPDSSVRTYPSYLIRPDRLERAAVRLLSSLERLEMNGLCVNDAARNLYEDRRSRMNRADTDTRIGEELEAVAVRKKLVMNGADLGAVKNASLIVSLPFDVCYGMTDSNTYEAVPLFPAMLHGKVLYTGTAVNSQSNPFLYLLKTVEFGGTPYYEWVCAQDSRLYYETDLSDALDFLAQMNEKLGDLLSEPISGHRLLRTGVYRTTYENGAVVLINYNNFSVNVNGITVAPYSFLRLN